MNTTSKKFNGLKVEGTYDFSTFCVSLSDYSSYEIDEIKNIKEYVDTQDIELIKYYGKLHALINHEYQHFLDSVCTNWGVDFFTKLSVAYSLKDEHPYNSPEQKYFLVKSFVNEQILIEYPYYYSLNLDDVSDNLPWELRPTIGSAFDYKGNPSSYPIMFASFFNKDKERFVRTPVSLITILECSSVIQEIRTLYNYSQYIKNQSEKIKFYDEINNTYKSLIYDRNLTEYSSCFHLVANKLRSSDLTYILTICEVLVELCLNFNEQHFNKIANVCDPKVDFEEKIKIGLKNKNRGILFFMLNHYFVNKVYKDKKTFIRDLDKDLAKYQLSYSMIMKDAEKDINENLKKISSLEFSEFKKISQSSRKNFKTIYRENYYSHKLDLSNKLEFPLIQCQLDKSVGSIQNNKNIGSIDPYIMDKKFSKYFKWAREFSDACFITEVSL